MADPWGSHRTDRGLRASGGGGWKTTAVEEAGAGGREGGHFRGAGTGGHFWGAGTGGHIWGAGTGGHIRGAGTGGHFRGAGTFEEQALEGTFEERALEDLTPPPCPAAPEVSSAHPQPRCRGRSSTPRSHRPRLAPSWWALAPALAPGLTGWAQLPGRSSAQSLGLALARRSRREMALRHRWAWADAPHRGEMVGWALGQEWIWRDHPLGRLWGAIRFSPESTPRRRQIPLEDHLRTTTLCTRCWGLRHRMSRVRHPGSWWVPQGLETV